MPYLQELLLTAGNGYTPFPQNYQSLVANLLRLNEVIFVTLNYDVILDRVPRADRSPQAGDGLVHHP